MKPFLSASLLVAISAGPVLAQEDQALFDAALVELDVGSVPFRHLSDIDGDGDLDAFGFFQNGSYARWAAAYENDGNGVFTWRWGTSSFGNFDFADFAVGDFDGDGLEDIVLSEWEYPDSSLEFYFRHDSGWFNRTAVPGPAYVQKLAAADLDGDGQAELIYTTVLGDTVEIGVGLHGPNPETYSVSHGFTDLVHTLKTLDADGDGDLDVLVGAGQRLGFALVDMGGKPVIRMGSTWNHALGNGVMMDVGDVDDDGDDDVALFGGGDPAQYRVLRQAGDFSWELEAAAVGGPAEFLYDVDADGDLDGVCCGGGGTPTIRGIDATDFQIALNDGTGVFEESFQIPGVGSPQLAGVADLDSDGDVDLIAGRCIYFARGPIQGPPLEATGLENSPPSHPRQLCDYDADGDVDVGLSLESVHRNDGTGSFTDERPVVQGMPRGVRLSGPGFPGDFDGDGAVDLLVEATPGQATATNHGVRASLGWNRAGTRMWLLKNDGAGGFLNGGPAAPRDLSLALDSLEATASLTADLDVDGDLDLVTRAIGPGSTERSRLWLNTGGGTFVPLLELSTEKVEHVADLDLDGVPDLVTLREHEVYVNRSQPSVLRGTLPASLPYYTPLHDLIDPVEVHTFVRPMAVGDVTGDGYLDLGFVRRIHPDENGTTSSSYEATLLLDRQGVGGYGYYRSNVLDPDEGMNSYSFLVFGDVDGDGVPDVLAGPQKLPGPFGAEKAILTEIHLKAPRAPLGFEEPRIQVIPPGLLVDVDGDGDLDVLRERLAVNVSAP